MDGYQILRATPKHAKDMVSIAKEGLIFNYSTLIYAILISMGWAYVILDKDNNVVGYSCYILLPLSRKAFSIQSSLRESCQGKGLGTKLLGFICEKVKRTERVDTIYAHILKPRVLKLCKKLGWKSVASILGIFLIKKKIRQ